MTIWSICAGILSATTCISAAIVVSIAISALVMGHRCSHFVEWETLDLKARTGLNPKVVVGWGEYSQVAQTQTRWYYNLYKCLALITEQNSQCLYTSCSQPFNVDDVVCNEPSKDTLLLLYFLSIKGRTTHTCPGTTFACGPRSYVVCNRGEFFDSPGSVHI